MLNNKTFYNGTIRKTIVAFGSLFSNIYIERKKDDSVSGEVVQKLQVPLAYAPKEKWIVRLDSDPNLEQNTYTTLPRMSFEITGYSYDPQRKLNRMNQIKCGGGSQNVNVLYTPVPYNLDISLYILTKTQEDALQIIEQILPTFTPEYTLSINAVEDMHVVIDVPTVLNSVSVSDEYDGDFQTRRFVLHTLTFQMKVNLFGGISQQGVIDTVNGNITESANLSSPARPARVYTATGDVATGTVNSEFWLDDF